MIENAVWLVSMIIGGAIVLVVLAMIIAIVFVNEDFEP